MARTNYLSWEEYFMGIAKLTSQRSKDPVTQVGACIVNSENKIVGIGYNGFPRGISDNDLPWGKIGDFLDTKYPYVCHAEMNSILNAYGSVKNCTLYTTLFPCNECTKLLIQSGIKEVIYDNDKHNEQESTIASRIMLDKVNITYRKIK